MRKYLLILFTIFIALLSGSASNHIGAGPDTAMHTSAYGVPDAESVTATAEVSKDKKASAAKASIEGAVKIQKISEQQAKSNSPPKADSLPKQRVYCLILAGQSNAAGYPYGATSFPLYSLTHMPAAYFGTNYRLPIVWNEGYNTFGRQSTFVPLRITTQNYITGLDSGNARNFRWGVEMSFAHRWLEYTGKPLYIIKNGWPAQELNRWYDTTDQSTPCWLQLKEATETFIAHCEQRNWEPVFLGVIWIQGESDCTNDWAPVYGGKLSRVINRWREINPTYLGEAPWVFQKLLPILTPYATGGATINAKFDSIATSNPQRYAAYNTNTQLSTSNILGDGFHYQGFQLIELGNDYFDLFKQKGWLLPASRNFKQPFHLN